MQISKRPLLKAAAGAALMVLIGAGAGAAEPAPATIEVPAGPFIMGSDRAEREAAYRLDEAAYGHARTRQWKWYENEPRRTVTTTAYRITTQLITNRQYLAFITATGHRVPDVDPGTWRSYKLIHPFARTRRHAWAGHRPPKGRANHPVVLVSHDDARAYAAWLSKETGRVWRLPSEVQWEKAARGTDGRYFPWGNAYEPGNLNSHDAGPFDTRPVGLYPKGASPFGLMDAAGQVFEWTSTKAGKNRHRVKGGSWDDKGCGVCRPAAGHARPDHLKHILVGFRLVSAAN